jgi:hypothetical protein
VLTIGLFALTADFFETLSVAAFTSAAVLAAILADD